MGEANGDQKSSLNNGSDEELGKGLIEPDQPDSEFSGIEITLSMKVSFISIRKLSIIFDTFFILDKSIGALFN